MDKRKNLRKRIFALISVCLVFILTFGMMLEEAYAYTLNYVVNIKSITDASGTEITTIDPTKSNVVITASYGSTKTDSDPPLQVTGTGNIEGKFTNLSETAAKNVKLSITSVSLNGAKGTAKSDYTTTIPYEYKEGDTTPATFSGIDLQVASLDPSSLTVKKQDSSKSNFSRSDFSVDVSGLDNDLAKKILIYNYNSVAAVKEYVDANKDQSFNMKIVIKNDIDDSAKKKIKDYVSSSSHSDANVDDNKFFDISLWLYAANAADYDKGVKISRTGADSDNKITVKVTINSDFKKTGRRFYVEKEHDGSVDTVAEGGATSSSSSSVSSLSFETNKFSAVNVAYKDYSYSSSSSSKSSSSKSSSSAGSGGTGGSTTTSGKSPKTGDDFSFLKWLYFVLIGGTIIYSSVTLLKDTHDDVDE